MRLLIAFLITFISIHSFGALRVTIDPGHGGSDDGAVHASTKESKIALSISKKLHNLLAKDKSFKPQILRNSDKDLALESRVRLADRFDTDLFISIHANANPDKRAKGAEFYIQNQLPLGQEKLFLAHHESMVQQKQHHKPQQTDVESILFDIKKTQKVLKSYQLSRFLRKHWPQKKKQMIRQGPFYVLSQNEIPAVLVEVGYLSHPKEREMLKSQSYQRKVARQIYNGLKDYSKNKKKIP
ncbi:MAG: N-acetylmuramoyl-L-alanine amidase [Bdellovibrionales bacterium]|nr:N-acetylmuramoyl-L-alanine amidase [Bdellovibrionales bacterium]NQZ18060.1 N-acetylmuramoyl-L-alanine amidase [Bdellovibrionales bacterium]